MTRPTREPDTFQEYFRPMADLQILAIQQKATRVRTFLLDIEQSRRTYSDIGMSKSTTA